MGIKSSVPCVINNTYCGSTLIDVLSWHTNILFNAERKAKPKNMVQANFMTSLFLCTGRKEITWLGDCNNGFCLPNVNNTDIVISLDPKKPGLIRPRGPKNHTSNTNNIKTRPNDTCSYQTCTTDKIYCTKELMANSFDFQDFADYFELVAAKNRAPNFTVEELHKILDSSRFICRPNNQIEFYDDDLSGCN